MNKLSLLLGLVLGASPAAAQILKPLPENISWTVEYRTKRSGPAAEGGRGTTKGLARQEITKTGSTRRFVETYYNGLEATAWVFDPGLVFKVLPGEATPSYVFPGPNQKVYFSNFDEFKDLAKPDYATEKKSVAGRPCQTYEKGGRRLLVEVESGRPLTFEDEREVRTYTFSEKPPAQLEIPEPVLKQASQLKSLYPE